MRGVGTYGVRVCEAWPLVGLSHKSLQVGGRGGIRPFHCA